MKLADVDRVIDADTHLTERHDLWTTRAPKVQGSRPPRGPRSTAAAWWRRGRAARLRRRGRRHRPRGQQVPLRGVHGLGHRPGPRGGLRPQARLEVMDACGIHAQVIYPNAVGLGGQNLSAADRRSGAAPPVRRDLQRRHGRAAGVVQQPVPAHADPAGVGHRRMRPRGRAGRRPRVARREHDLRPPGPRLARPGPPGLGPAVGGVRRSRSAGALPHRGQPDRDELLREVLLAVTARVRQAGHRWLDAVPGQRPGGASTPSSPASSTGSRS